MKTYIYSISLILLFSCTKSRIEPSFEGIKYTIDTVIINSNNEPIDLTNKISISDLGNNENTLFIYNSFDHSIDKIILDSQIVKTKIPLTKEGPNGTGYNISSIKVLNDGNFFIKSSTKIGIFDSFGNLKKEIEWKSASISNDKNKKIVPRSAIMIEGNVFGLIYNEKKKEVFLDILDTLENSISRFNIDINNAYSGYVLEINDPNSYSFLDPMIQISLADSLVIISHEFSNDLILYNINLKEIETIEYFPKLTPASAENVLGTQIISSEILSEKYQSFLEQVRFSPPVWDKSKKIFYRLSAIKRFSDSKKEEEFIPETLKTNVYLTIFDCQFNVKSELEIPELQSESGKYFVKNGKLWIYQNFNDELGFLVLDIKNND
jgi:hypothetical protein